MNRISWRSARLHLLALFLLLGLMPAAAQGDLYGPETPQDIAWIRILNAGPEQVTALLDGQELTAGPLGATAYVPLEPGLSSIEVQGEPVELSVQAGQFLTLALLPDGPLVVMDPALRDVSRGLLGIMNLTDRLRCRC